MAATALADTTPIGRPRFGLLASCGCIASVLVCYGQIAILAVLSIIGIDIAKLNPHLQAALMSAFAVVALFGLLQDRRLIGDLRPTVLAAAGTLVMFSTLYYRFDARAEFIAYALLITAVLLNHNAALKTLHRLLDARAAQLTDLNRTLEDRVAKQVAELERLGRLRRFLSPQVADLIVSSGDDSMLQSHRREIATLFADLRGFTDFVETVEPEEAMNALKAYHQVVGELIARHEGTIDHLAGDGVMVIFNDPVPCEEPAVKAVRLALDMRDALEVLRSDWERAGYALGFGVGVSFGYATLGVVGHAGRFDYTANGSVINLAARLCDEAADRQILVNRRVHAAVEHLFESEPVAELSLKGFLRPVEAFNVLRPRT